MSLSEDLVSGASGAAQFTGLTERAIYHLVSKGELPVRRIGRRMYFLKSALLAVFTPEDSLA